MKHPRSAASPLLLGVLFLVMVLNTTSATALLRAQKTAEPHAERRSAQLVTHTTIEDSEQASDEQSASIDNIMHLVYAKIAAVQQENARMRHILSGATRLAKAFKKKQVDLDSARQEINELHTQLRTLAHKEVEADVGLESERKQIDSLDSRLHNVTSLVALDESALKEMRSRFSFERQLNAKLLHKLQDASTLHQELSEQIADMNRTIHAVVGSARQKDEELRSVEVIIRQTQAELGTVSAAKAKQAKELQEEQRRNEMLMMQEEDTKRQMTERVNDLAKQEQQEVDKQKAAMSHGLKVLGQKLVEANKRQEEARDEWTKDREALDHLNKVAGDELAAEREELHKVLLREARFHNLSSSRVAALSARIEALSANASRYESEAEQAGSLQREVGLLQRRLLAEILARKQATNETNRLSDLMGRANLEIKELKATVPKMQAMVLRETQIAQAASTEAARAREARESAKSSLAKAQHDMSQLQAKYAQNLRSLVSEVDVRIPQDPEGHEMATTSAENNGKTDGVSPPRLVKSDAPAQAENDDSGNMDQDDEAMASELSGLSDAELPTGAEQ